MVSMFTLIASYSRGAGQQLQVQGGFQYKSDFFKLEPGDRVLLKDAIASDRADGDTLNPVMASKKRIDKMHNGPHGENYRCGTGDLTFNKRQGGAEAKIIKSLNTANIRRMPRKAKDEIIRGANAGCPVKTQQLTVAVVADCNYVNHFGSRKKARQNILNDMNLVSGIFTKTYNIDLSVNSVELLDKCDKGDSFNLPCKDYPGLDLALNRFSAWRDGRNGDAGIYHLVTSCNYSETVGLAWVNQVCRTKSFTDSQADVISGTSMSVLVDDQFSVIAHELAHNLGAIHDCDRRTCDGGCKDPLDCQCCPCDDCDCKGRYIMDAQSGGFGTLEFSSCTIKDICDKLPYLGTCIKDQAEKIPDLISVCGNGIREGEEECDCGSAEECAKSKCCLPTCKLKPNAKCADENDTCCRDCEFAAASAKEVCRVASSSCQEDTICDGKSGACPKTIVKADGVSCSVDGKCASGVCTSRNAQCSIFGRHLNVTQSCLYTTRSCSVICQGPEQCLDLNANYIDGTPCGEKGFCYLGMCTEFGSDAVTGIHKKYFPRLIYCSVPITLGTICGQDCGLSRGTAHGSAVSSSIE